jgi:glycosyltransferase involved in cell wall biosynthesis
MKKRYVVSAINFFQGGPLSVLTDFLSYLNAVSNEFDIQVFAFVHKKNIFELNQFENITFYEFPKSRKSYIYRFYYEFIYFKKIAHKLKIDLWISFHDISPNLRGIPQVVYCHNPAPFYQNKFSLIFKDPLFYFFSQFYGYIYKINIHKNKFIIVQQQWLRDEFLKRYGLLKSKIIVALPEININYNSSNELNEGQIKFNTKHSFFFPSMPRSFKNIEVICDAIEYLHDYKDQFDVYLTISGHENYYSRKLFKRYSKNKNLIFLGVISRSKVFSMYSFVDTLIFPSKIETWGLPISEFKIFNKPIILADLPYARETIGCYSKVSFFPPDNYIALANLMKQSIQNMNVYDNSYNINYESPYAKGWAHLFNLLKV